MGNGRHSYSRNRVHVPHTRRFMFITAFRTHAERTCLERHLLNTVFVTRGLVSASLNLTNLERNREGVLAECTNQRSLAFCTLLFGTKKNPVCQANEGVPPRHTGKGAHRSGRITRPSNPRVSDITTKKISRSRIFCSGVEAWGNLV